MKGFGVELIPLCETDLEMVRLWRIDSEVAQFMEFQSHIDELAQQTWFLNLQNAHYFVIIKDSIPVGLINLKDVDLKNGTAESGLLIGDAAFRGTGVALGASILLLDFAFEQLGLKSVTAKMNRHHTDAISYNQFLGFHFDRELSETFQLWVLTKENYQRKRANLVKILG